MDIDHESSTSYEDHHKKHVVKTEPKVYILESSYADFTRDKLLTSMQFGEGKYYEKSPTEPLWNPLTELATQILKLPQDALYNWLKEHVGEFTSRFESRYRRSDSSENVCECEKNNIESQVVHHYCSSLLENIIHHCTVLKAQFPGLRYDFYLGCVPEEASDTVLPCINPRVIVLTAELRGQNLRYPAVVVVPTGFSMHPNDYTLLKESILTISKHWTRYTEFYGVMTNFRTTIFVKYDRCEKKYYQHDYIVNFYECYLQGKSPEKLEDFYKTWFGLVYKAFQVHSERTSRN